MQNTEINPYTIKTDRLFWEKYRPQTLDEMILPNRIRTVVKHGIQTNMLFVGTPGIGKTTLARILVQKHPHIVKSAKLGVDVLRNDVLSFCQTIVSGVFDTDAKPNIKVVYLEEFDGASKQLQEELRAFIEQFEHKVRFIATANNASKIIDAMHSRFNIIDFTPKNQDEIKQIKVDFAKRLISIAESEKLNVKPEQIKEIIKSNFPDLRKCMSIMQLVHLTGTTEYEEHYEGDTDIYQIISNKSATETWNYLYSNWLDRLDAAFDMFGREYWSYIEQNKPNELNKMPERMDIITEYVNLHLPNARDPFVTLYAMICKLQKV